MSRLILINLLIWIGINLVRVVAFLFQTPGNPIENQWITSFELWLAVPAGFEAWIQKPWTIFTYMFLHLDFWHILFNMLGLYWFGKIFLEFKKGRDLLVVYLFGGILGAVTFMMAFNFFPVFREILGQAVALGASASVLAIVVATAMLVPQYVIHLLFIGPIKIKYIALIMIILDIFMIRSGNAGGHFAHLGGALAGVITVFFMKSSFSIPTIPPLKMFRSKSRIRKVHATGKPLSDEDYNRIRAQKQARIDLILDKIAKSGYKSLTEEEKEFLFKFSKK